MRIGGLPCLVANEISSGWRQRREVAWIRPRELVITDRRQNPTLPDGACWTFYATFVNLLQAAVAFGVNDIKRLCQRIHSHDFHRVHLEQMLLRA